MSENLHTILNNCEVMLFDVCNTFMFGTDRFSEKENYLETYKKIGGNNLNPDEIKKIISELLKLMVTESRNETLFESIPPIHEYINRLEISKNLSEEEKFKIERVFELHEVGTVSQEYIDILKKLSKKYELGIISNICSNSKIFKQAFDAAGISDLFEVVVFSSEHNFIKPSPKIFQEAVKNFDVPLEKIVYVGDHLIRDVLGAQSIGIKAIWVETQQRWKYDKPIIPDAQIKHLRELILN
ncbi:MAG TPA: HAD family hydrolase [Ignavibacteria bacterium]|nr:HAD family hydrolase [Ignavibacteria bacterium]